MADPAFETDWAAAWRALVEAREADSAAAPQPGYWDRRAAGFAYSMRDAPDPFFEFLEPWLDPGKTAIDAGAGTGRHALRLADRLEWVTAVEPSEGMRAHIEPRDNLTVIASSWEDADPAPADLVICSHVLYGVAEVAPFLEKLEARARERVFVYLRDCQMSLPSEALWRRLAGSRARMPEFRDLYLVLRGMGVAPDVTMVEYAASRRYPDLEAAVEEVSAALGERWEDASGRAFLEERLQPSSDGGLLWDAGPMRSGIAHWKPRS
ncbi:MAG TPA: class I SAM-dependent methyltransferase [Candidatus Dormibacteraeota bacterium]